MNQFLESCKEFNRASKTLYDEVDKLAEKLIKFDLEEMLAQNINNGFNVIIGDRAFQEIDVNGSVFNLINRKKQKYKAYVLHFKKEFALPYLGFKYKGEVVSPHLDGQPEQLISQYNEKELNELVEQIEIRISRIREDLSYIAGIENYREIRFYYRNYDGMFDGDQIFENIKEVIKDYENLG